MPLLASGKVLGGFGLTEPGAGSDAGGTATTAVDKGDHYLLNGSKIFITHAGVGEIFSVTARTEPGKGSRGITSFIVTKDTVDLAEAARVGVGHAADLPKIKGVRAGKKEDKMGWRASDTRELVFEDAIVPEGERARQPWATGSSTSSRRSMPAGSASPRCRSASPRGPTTRRSSTPATGSSSARRSARSRGCSFQLADMALEIEAGTHLLYHAAWLKQNGKPFKKEAAMAKLFCSELAMRATTKAVQIFGGYGYTTEYPVERMMRDAKVCEIGEGTSEIQRMVIARHILGDVVNG